MESRVDEKQDVGEDLQSKTKERYRKGERRNRKRAKRSTLKQETRREERRRRLDDREEGEKRERREGGWEGKATLTPQEAVCLFFSSGVLTDVLEAGIDRSIIKIHTADSQRVQLGIVMPHHLNIDPAHTHTHTHTHGYHNTN